MNSVISKLGLDRFSGVYLGVILVIVFGFATPEFLTPATFHVIASSQSIAGIIAIALLIPMVAGQYDLSVGTNANLTGLVVVALQGYWGWSLPAALISGVALGVLIGFVNGFIVVVLKVDSFIATLGVSSILTASVIIVTNSVVPPQPTSAGWKSLTQFEFGGFQIVIVYLIVLALLAWWLLEFTPAGRYLHAIGSNRDAARLAGVRVNRWSWVSLVLSGGIAGIGGILYTSLTGPSFTFGATLLLPAFAAVFLGSTQLFPGRFNVWGTLLAIFVLALGVQGLQLLSGVTWLSPMFNGIALIAAVALAVSRGRSRSKGSKQSKDVQPPNEAAERHDSPALTGVS
ncbi:ABC transporter permease [Subtercola endophyticus]|uniref:ABC transporter permease n=1 Tax=Subtercola endophyticus TaxID=2895559 RepID=UPI001E5161C3|nr:ABC transporter permease [Subtercola endophyticus]UFS58116.1 ABC transporter permease [Subtercola endophyticus]